MADIYAKRTLTKAMELLAPVGRTFIDTFYKGEVQYLSTRLAEVHIFRGGRRMAAFVEPNMPGEVAEREGFNSGTVKLPYLKPKRPLRPVDTQSNQLGQHLYDRADPNQTAEKMLRNDLLELRARIQRREEWMGARGLCGGVVQVVGEGINATITYPYLATHKPTLGSTDLWTHADSDPIAQLREWGRLIVKDSGLPPTDLFLGSEAVDALVANAKVQAHFNRLNMNMGAIQLAREQAAGDETTRVYLGKIEGVSLWEVRDWYDLGDGSGLQPMLGAKSVLLGSNRADNRRHYGLIEDFDEAGRIVTARTDIFVKSWVEQDPAVRWMLAQSAPLPIPHDLDAFVYVAAVKA